MLSVLFDCSSNKVRSAIGRLCLFRWPEMGGFMYVNWLVRGGELSSQRGVTYDFVSLLTYKFKRFVIRSLATSQLQFKLEIQGDVSL